MMFYASKVRNIVCEPQLHDVNGDPLQVSNAKIDGRALAATVDHFAFPHQLDSGAAIQVQSLKQSLTPSLILRGHTGHVNALTFSPFDRRLLLSGSADKSVRVWKLESESSICLSTMSEHEAVVSVLECHPTVQGIIAGAGQGDWNVYDLQTETIVRHYSSPNQVYCGLGWNYEGSILLTCALNQQLCLWDARNQTILDTVPVHTGRRPNNVVWCGSDHFFITTGSDNMQEREVKLWDHRNLTSCVHRVRLDSTPGTMFPLYDPDLNLLYILGKGDRSARCFEVDATRRPFLHARDHSVLPHMTVAAAMQPKQACDTTKCEVGRILSISHSNNGGTGGSCTVLSYFVERKEGKNAFQRDLYPDTAASIPALTIDAWLNGENAQPVLKAVVPTIEMVDDGVRSMFGTHHAAFVSDINPSLAPVPSAWGAQSSAWSTAANSSTNPSLPKWNSKATAWNATPSMTVNLSLPVQWVNSPSKIDDEPIESPSEEPTSSTKIKSSHKLKYLQGQLGSRNETFSLGNWKPAYASTTSSPIIKANMEHWAVPLTGTGGGPVMVQSIDTRGRVVDGHEGILNGHKTNVTDLDFHAFNTPILATGAADGSVCVWNVLTREDPIQLSGHTKAIRSVLFHPIAGNMLCTSSYDLTIRLWDIEYGMERVCIDGKLEDGVWNTSFSPDGAYLATSSRAKLVRVFDPRISSQALMTMGCGLDSPRPQFVSWVSTTRLLTVGTTSQKEAELRIWDARNLEDPLSITTIHEATAAVQTGSTLFPMYDASSCLLFLVALGGRHVYSYELVNETPVANLPFVAEGQDAISAAMLLPKQVCNVRKVEVDRMLLLRQQTIDRLSFTLPRAEKLQQYFQDDIYRPVRSRSLASSQSIDSWLASTELVAEYESLQPIDMIPLSNKPIEETLPSSRNQEYRARWEQEEYDKKKKEENLARLHALAAQPSYHTHNRIPHEMEEVDTWDEE